MAMKTETEPPKSTIPDTDVRAIAARICRKHEPSEEVILETPNGHVVLVVSLQEMVINGNTVYAREYAELQVPDYNPDIQPPQKNCCD